MNTSFFVVISFRSFSWFLILLSPEVPSSPSYINPSSTTSRPVQGKIPYPSTVCSTIPHLKQGSFKFTTLFGGYNDTTSNPEIPPLTQFTSVFSSREFTILTTGIFSFSVERGETHSCVPVPSVDIRSFSQKGSGLIRL